MNPDLEVLNRFPVFSDFTAAELSAVNHVLEEKELSPGEVLFDERDPGDSCYFLHLGRIQIDKETTPNEHEVLAELNAPTILGEMAILRQASRSARAIAMRPCVLWEMSETSLNELAAQDNAASYKIMKWIAHNLSERLSTTNDKLIDIYAKPAKSIVELKQRLKELQPAMVSVGFDE